MLLNPSHKITFSGLPPDVLDAYVRYKKGTRALVAWFIQYSPSPNRRVKSLPIKELESLAQAASKKVRSLPDLVHFYFRETIAARKKLSKYFRGNVDQSLEDVDTINHEHFTTSLAQIYDNLCARCGHHHFDLQAQKQRSKPGLAEHANEVVNAYHGLPVEDVDEDEGVELLPTLSGCPECTASAQSPCNDEAADVRFSDDGLGRFLEVTVAIERIKDITWSVGQCWDHAGKNDLSFPVAAFVTNVAFASIRQVGIELLHHDENLSVSELHRRFCSRNSSDQEEESGNGDSDQTASHVLLDELQDLEQAILNYRDRRHLFAPEHCAACVQKPADYFQLPSGEGSRERGHLAEAILDNIYHLITSKENTGSIIRNSAPVYTDAGYVVTSPEEQEQARTWPTVLGLHLLTSGYKSYLQSIEAADAISKCRLTALRLAQQASAQISSLLRDETCWPCRCPDTLAFHLQNLEADLRAYTKHRCWDLYFQSPWVAGNQVLEMLDLCHYYGTRLFNYRHYVGAVLHAYNVLQQLGDLEAIPVLEALCTQFSGVFFPSGKRPQASFRASWGRYVGARLKFPKGHRRNARSSDGWCMAIPAHAARRAAGFGAMDDHDHNHNLRPDCLLFKIKQQDYHLSHEQWDSLDHATAWPKDRRNPATSRHSSSMSASKTYAAHGGPPPPLLALADALQHTLDPSHTALLPTPRLNLFAVFEDCVRVVSRLSDTTHTGKDEKGMNCICFASSILTAADRICDHRRLGRAETWNKHERQCVDLTKDALRHVFANVKAEQWLWEI